jgi:hypothetical protein
MRCDARKKEIAPRYCKDVRGSEERVEKALPAHSLSQAFNIEPYVLLRAISSDGRRLLVSRQDCPFDCRNTRNEYYEVGLPAAKGNL